MLLMLLLMLRMPNTLTTTAAFRHLSRDTPFVIAIVW
jgi:hypothetical protein